MKNLNTTIILPQTLLVLFSLFSFYLNAASITWTNGSGDNNWNTITNWSSGTIPGSSDIAIFDGTSIANCNMNTSVNVAGININSGYTGTITQNSGNTITIGSSSFSQADGTFAGGDSDIDINSGGAFILNGGTFTCTSSTLSIGGSVGSNYTIFNHSGGTFNHNGGKVMIDPDLSGCSTRTVTMTASASSWPQFYDFEVKVNNTSCNEDVLSITSGDTIVVLNDFTHTDGYINTGVIQCEGHLFLESGADGGTGTLYITNTADVAYSNTSTSRFPKIVVNKAGGSISPAPGTNDFYCQQLTLISGDFTAPSGTFYIGGTWGSNVTLLSYTGGTFDHNNGIVRLDPDFSGCATRTATITSSASPKIEFYDLFVDVDNTSCNEDILSITSGDTIVVSNDFTHQDGYINTGVVRVLGDIYLNSGADGGSATIHINDAAANQEYHNSTTSRFAHIKVDKAGGTFTSGVGTTDFYCQQLTLISGDFTAPSGTFYIGGTWGSNVTLLSHTGGTFDHNNGIVRLDPDFSGCATRTATITSSASPKIEFYDLFVDVDNTSCNEDILSITSGDTIAVSNDFTHQDGYINTGVVRVLGDIYLNSGADGGSATIHINDAAANQEYHNSTTSRFAHINVDKAGGTFTPGVGTTDFYCQQFTLTSGDFTAPTGTFYIGGPWGSNVTLLSHIGGTFDHNNGIVRLDPDFSGCATRTATITSSASPKIEFYDLFVDVDNTSCNEDILSITSGDTIAVSNDFTHQDGYINTGVVRVLGDIYLNSGADGGSATIHINDAVANQQYHNSTTSRFAHINVDKAGGTFTPGVGTTDFYCQQFTLTSGDFTAPTGTFYIGGPWGSNVTLLSHTGGTFDHNNGIVRLDPDFSGCATRTATITSSASPKIEFYDLFVDVDNTSCNEDILSITSGDTIAVSNDFTHQDGYINTGVVRVLGDIYLNSGADGGSATIHINDAAANQEYHNSTTSRFAHIKVDKAGGTFTPGVGTTDFYCQQLTLISGSFTAPSDTFYIGGPWGANVTLLSHTGGTFNHNNGTVSLDPDFSGCATRTATVVSSVSPKIEFYDLIVDVDNTSCNEDILSVASSDTIKVLNDFTFVDGYINTGTVWIEGDILMRSGADGGTGMLYLTNTNNQEYSNSSTSRFPHIFVDKSSGTVSPAAGTTDLLMQRLTLNSGTFNCPTGNINIGGTWDSNITLFDHIGGTLNHNNSTLYIDPDFSGCSTRTATIDLLSSTEFQNVYIDIDNISCNEDRLTITGGDTLKVNGNLTLNDGQVNTGAMNVQGNVQVNSGFDGGDAELIFSGNAAQIFDLTGADANFNAPVNIDKSNDVVRLLSDFQMDAGSGNDLYLNNGNIVSTSANLLIIGDNVEIYNASVNSYVSGPIRKIGDDAFDFPTGKNDDVYAPMSMTAPGSTTDHFTAEYIDNSPMDDSYDTSSKDVSLDHLSDCEYWKFERTNGSSNVNVTLSWDDRSCGVTVLSELSIGSWDGSQWIDLGNGGTTGTTSSGTIVSSFASPDYNVFTLGSTTANNPLPIELLSYDVKLENNNVRIDWVTAVEINNDYFVVERSTDAYNFEELETVEGAGNTESIRYYAVIDRFPFEGISYYRLKQVDFDGTTTYYDIKMIDNSDGYTDEYGLTVFPNPIMEHNKFSIGLEGFDGNSVQVKIQNMNGFLIYSDEINISQERELIELETNIIQDSGMYIVSVFNDNRWYQHKFMFIK